MWKSVSNRGKESKKKKVNISITGQAKKKPFSRIPNFIAVPELSIP